VRERKDARPVRQAAGLNGSVAHSIAALYLRSFSIDFRTQTNDLRNECTKSVVAFNVNQVEIQSRGPTLI
jgi:hypothetical protein